MRDFIGLALETVMGRVIAWAAWGVLMTWYYIWRVRYGHDDP